MRWPIVAITATILLLVLVSVASTVDAAKQQKRYQLLRSKLKQHTHKYSHMMAQARSEDTAVASAAPTFNSDQKAGDSGRGFMAKLMKLKSLLQPPQTAAPSPPPSNVILLTEPAYITTATPTTPTTPTTTSSTLPITFTTPTTTSVATNTSRSGPPTVLVYARQDNNALVENAGGLTVPGSGHVEPHFDTNAAKPLFMSTKPVAITNQIPMIAQLPRPLQQQEQQHQQRLLQRQRQRQQQRRRNNRGGQLNQNKRRRRLQQQQNKQKQVRIGSEPNNHASKRRRIQVRGPPPGMPLKRRNQHRKVAKFPNQNHIVNRKGIVANGNDMVINNMPAIAGASVGVGAGNNFDTNSRLQQFMNGLRHSQTPIVYNRH